MDCELGPSCPESVLDTRPGPGAAAPLLSFAWHRLEQSCCFGTLWSRTHLLCIRLLCFAKLVMHNFKVPQAGFCGSGRAVPFCSFSIPKRSNAQQMV